MTGSTVSPTLSNRTMLDGVAVPDYYGPLALARHHELMSLAGLQEEGLVAACFGVAWRVMPAASPRRYAGWRPVRQVGGFAVDANQHYRGLAWPVFQVESEKRLRALLPRAGEGPPELLVTAFVRHPEAIEVTAPPAAQGQARLLRQDARGYVFECDLSHEGLLLITSCWYPGVHARVDGRPAPVLEANLAFCAVPVPAGRHRVELGYRPTGLGTGLLLSAMSLALVMWGLWALRRWGFRSA